MSHDLTEDEMDAIARINDMPERMLAPRAARRAHAKARGYPFHPVLYYQGRGRCGRWRNGIPHTWEAPAHLLVPVD